MKRFDQKKLDEKIRTLQDSEEIYEEPPFSYGLIAKIFILLPIFIVITGLFVVNSPQNILTILGFGFLSILCIFLGVSLYSLLGR